MSFEKLGLSAGWSAEEVEQALRQLEADDVLAREAVREVAEVAGWAKRDVYRLWLAVKGAR